MKEHHVFMKLAAEKAQETMRRNIGGPFGAVITDADGNVLAATSNHVLANHDPTAHAEIMAIRDACRKLGTHDLSGCTIYATGYPCPMCLGAIIWANIRMCYYANPPQEAAKIGFRDDFIYDYIRMGNSDPKVLRTEQLESEACRTLYEDYEKMEKEIY